MVYSGTPDASTNKTDRHDITEILFKVTLNTIDQRNRSWRGVLLEHYVIQFVSDLRQVGDFLRVLHIPPPIKLTPRYK